MDYDSINNIMSEIQTTELTALNTTEAATLAAVGFGVMSAVIFACIIVYVLQSIFMMQLFKKSKVARWKAWIPIVNSWTFLQIGGQKGWWIFAGVAGAIIGYIFFAMAGMTGVLGDTSKIGVDVAIGGLAVVGYLIMLAGTILAAVFTIISAYNVGKKLGWGGGMVVLYIFFPIIWLGIAGLSKTKLDDKKGQPNLAKTV